MTQVFWKLLMMDGIVNSELCDKLLFNAISYLNIYLFLDLVLRFFKLLLLDLM